jgi:hypothetical protein
MIKYEYYDTWWMWDTTTIVVFILMSCYAYYYLEGVKSGRIKENDDESLDPPRGKANEWFMKKVNPFWFCLAISLMSFVFVGLNAIIVVGSYLISTSYWKYKWKKEND